MDPISTKDQVTLALAAVGAVLGVINTWKGWDKDRPKLRLVPKRAFRVDERGNASPNFLCFEVTNLSSFPLTITEVGVTYWWSRKRGVLSPIIRDGGDFPRKLEPRTSMSAYAAPGALKTKSLRVLRAYVKTDCGLTFRASSPALRQLILDENLQPPPR